MAVHPGPGEVVPPTWRRERERVGERSVRPGRGSGGVGEQTGWPGPVGDGGQDRGAGGVPLGRPGEGQQGPLPGLRRGVAGGGPPAGVGRDVELRGEGRLLARLGHREAQVHGGRPGLLHHRDGHHHVSLEAPRGAHHQVSQGPPAGTVDHSRHGPRPAVPAHHRAPQMHSPIGRQVRSHGPPSCTDPGFGAGSGASAGCHHGAPCRASCVWCPTPPTPVPPP